MELTVKKINDAMIKTKNLIDKYAYVCLFAIFVVFMFSRLFRLGTLPYGVNVDEMAIGLDGKYLSEYGMDRNLDHLPVYPKNHGGGMSALYVYMLAILFKFVPYSITAVRIPAVLTGILCFFYSFRLCKELFNDKATALLGPIFVTIMPFYMSSQRWGLDCNQFLSLMTVALFYYIRAVKHGKIKDYVFSGIWLGITLYTYVISYVVLVVFLLLTVLYLVCIKEFSFKKYVALAIPLFLLALPLILFQLVNMGIIPEFTFLGSDYHKLTIYRESEISLSYFANNLKFIPVLFFGFDGLNYNAFDIKAFGATYAYMAPVIVTGFVWMLVDVIIGIRNNYGKKMRKVEVIDNSETGSADAFMIILLFFLPAFLLILIMWDPHINKVNEIYLPFMIFAVYAVNKLSKKWSIVAPAVLLVSGIFFLLYSKFYFLDQKERYGYHELFYGIPAYEIVQYAENTYNPDGSKTVYLEQEYADQGAEVFLLSALKDVPPTEFSLERTEFGNVRLHFPEEYDENENAIYILGYTWNHISEYLSQNGFNVDTTFPNYLILYR